MKISYFVIFVLSLGFILYVALGHNNSIGDALGVYNDGSDTHMSLPIFFLIFGCIGMYGWKLQQSKDLFLKFIGWSMIGTVIVVLSGHSPTEIGAVIIGAVK